MKNITKKLFTLIGLGLLGISMGIANATPVSSSDCDDDDVQPPELHSTQKVTNKIT